MEILSKTIPCKLLANNDFSMEECKQLLDTDLSNLIELMTIPITNLGSLKIEAYKLGLSWIEEKGYTIFTLTNKRISKVGYLGKWITLNPDLPNMDYGTKETIFSLLKLIPGSFSILLGNTPTSIKELKETLNILPF